MDFDLVAVGLAVLLGAIGAIHFYWAVGGRWPGTDGVTLAARVIGTEGRALLGFFAWASITVAFWCAVGVVIAGQFPVDGLFHALVVYGGYLVLILVFTLRGVAPYVTDVFGYARGTPFYTLNRRYYAPVCLLLVAGLIIDFPPGVERFIA